MSAATTQIWDPGIRLFHWLLVLSLLASYGTAKWGWLDMEWHFRFGYLAIGLLIFRLIWGLIGGRYARFSDFVRGPRTILAYLRSGVSPSPGHNPLGALSVLALLAVVAAQAITGLFASDDIYLDGPFAAWTSLDTISRMTSLHRSNINLLMLLIVVHLLAIAVHVLWLRQRLIRPMISGHKPDLPASTADGRSSWWRLLLAIGIAAGMVWLMLWIAERPWR